MCAVFGGSRGIGRAVAQLLAQKGYRLAVVARNLEAARAAAGALGGRYPPEPVAGAAAEHQAPRLHAPGSLPARGPPGWLLCPRERS